MIAMLYFTYWRCCAHQAAGMAVGASMTLMGIAAATALGFALADSGGDCVDLAFACFSDVVLVGLIILFVAWAVSCIGLLIGIAVDDR